MSISIFLTTIKNKLNKLNIFKKTSSKSLNYLDILPDDILETIYQIKYAMERDDIIISEKAMFTTYEELNKVELRDYYFIDNRNDYIKEQIEIINNIESYLGRKISNIYEIYSLRTDPIISNYIQEYDFILNEWKNNEENWAGSCDTARRAEHFCIHAMNKYINTIARLNHNETGYTVFSQIYYLMIENIVNAELAQYNDLYINLDDKQRMRSPFVAPNTIIVCKLFRFWKSLSSKEHDEWNKCASIKNLNVCISPVIIKKNK